MARAAGKFGTFPLLGEISPRDDSLPLTDPLSNPASRLPPVDVVRARVTASIALGFLRPGARLPDPDVLAASLDVSPITVRRALESLHRDGLLERRRGRAGGTFVSSSVEPSTLAAPAAPVDEVEDPQLAAHRRLVIECGIVALVAAARPSAAVLRACLTTSAPDAPGGPTRAISTESAFHGRLAALSGLTGASGQLQAAITETSANLPTDPRSATVIMHDHEAIVDALLTADTDRAVHLMRDHLHRLHDGTLLALPTGAPPVGTQG